MLKTSSRLSVKRLRPSCLFIGVCNKVLISFYLRCWTLSLIYSLMTSSICVKLDPGTQMWDIWCSFWNLVWHFPLLVPHSNFWELRSTLKKGKLWSAHCGMNLFRAAILLSFCTSLIDWGSCILQRSTILSGSASMPLEETRHPRTFPLCTPKMHFSGLRLRLAFLRFAKVSARSWMWSYCAALMTTMSSM